MCNDRKKKIISPRTLYSEAKKRMPYTNRKYNAQNELN